MLIASGSTTRDWQDDFARWSQRDPNLVRTSRATSLCSDSTSRRLRSYVLPQRQRSLGSAESAPHGSARCLRWIVRRLPSRHQPLAPGNLRDALGTLFCSARPDVRDVHAQCADLSKLAENGVVHSVAKYPCLDPAISSGMEALRRFRASSPRRVRSMFGWFLHQSSRSHRGMLPRCGNVGRDRLRARRMSRSALPALHHAPRTLGAGWTIRFAITARALSR